MEQDKIRRRRLVLVLRIFALTVITLGMLHAVTLFWKARNGIDLVTLGLIVYAWLPFLLCLLLAVGKRNPLIPMCGALLPLIMNLFLDYSVFSASDIVNSGNRFGVYAFVESIIVDAYRVSCGVFNGIIVQKGKIPLNKAADAVSNQR